MPGTVENRAKAFDMFGSHGTEKYGLDPTHALTCTTRGSHSRDTDTEIDSCNRFGYTPVVSGLHGLGYSRGLAYCRCAVSQDRMCVGRSFMAADGLTVNVGAWLDRSVVNGPGERFVLWLQGCLLRCPGCINQEFQPLTPRHIMSVDDVSIRILGTKGIEGVTYSGGEPMLQAQALTRLSERLKSAGMTIVCYTGCTLEELHTHQDPWVQSLLKLVDILIDGPFIQGQAASLLWRGSRNQRVHLLTDAYRAWSERIGAHTGQVEFSIDRGSFTTTGTWPDGFLERLEKLLRG